MLLGTYEHAESFAYQDEIGHVLLTICQVSTCHFCDCRYVHVVNVVDINLSNIDIRKLSAVIFEYL